MNRVSLIMAFVLTFGAGVFFGSGRLSVSPSSSSLAEATEHSEGRDTKKSDVLSVGASGAVRAGVSSSEATDAPRFDLYNEKTRASLEAYLRAVPFPVLKQVYYERQDVEFDKANERYPSAGKDLNEADLARRREELTAAYLRASEGASTYFAESEWKLRGGRVAPVRVFAKFYTNVPSVISGEPSVGPASAAGSEKELCWTVSLYVKVSEKFAMESTSTCLNWTSVREGVPFAVLQTYSKSLIPYFDSVSVPLPGFGLESGASPEWFDSSLNRWSELTALRWEPKERSEIVHLEKELQAEMAR